jgi:hypothetical protein
LGYSLQVNKKKQAGAQHPDRDRQFKYIAALKAQFLGQGLPVISVDTKKKELIGSYRREGKSWRRQPIEVDSHFAGYAQCVAVPFGIYDLARNAGYVTVGISGNTSDIRRAAVLRIFGMACGLRVLVWIKVNRDWFSRFVRRPSRIIDRSRSIVS